MIVIAVVPVPLCSPATLMLVPPAMTTAPASLADFMKVMTSLVRLPALPAVPFNRFVKLVIGVRNATLAVVGGVQPRNCAEC
jgi:hypothetical protein